jgi:SIR2-like domain
VGLIDRLCAFLQQDDAVLFTCGYSFGDNHINERIVTSLRRGGHSHIIAMYFDELQNSTCALADEKDKVRNLATRDTGGKMSVYGRRLNSSPGIALFLAPPAVANRMPSALFWMKLMLTLKQAKSLFLHEPFRRLRKRAENMELDYCL